MSMISQPQCLHELGQRQNNEDCIFPAQNHATPQNTLFMVCDGVGGSAKGEVASQLTTEGFAAYFAQNNIEISDENSIQLALNAVQESFDTYSIRVPSTAQMASTLTLLHLHSAGATVAHVGDSRVYHLRNGRIRWQTEDHKMVTEMVRAGVLTSEQAVGHPQLNVISRAVQGKKIKTVKADVELIPHLLPDDYFFLCTDGVLEHLSDEMLEDIIKNTPSDSEKIKLIEQVCAGRTQDNYSAYLVHIVEEIGQETAFFDTSSEQDVIEIDVQDSSFSSVIVPSQPPSPLPPYAKKTRPNLPKEEPLSGLNWKLIVLVILLAATAGWFLYRQIYNAPPTQHLLNTPVKPPKKQ